MGADRFAHERATEIGELPGMSDAALANDPDIPVAFDEYLRNKARKRELVTYGEVAPLPGIDTGNEYFGMHVGRTLDALNRWAFWAIAPADFSDRGFR